MVRDVQGVRNQQGTLASSVSGVLDQCHGLDRRVENSTTQGALAVGRVQGVGQAVESLQKQLTEVQRAAYTPSKIDLSSVLAPLVSPLSTHLDAHGGGLGPRDRNGLSLSNASNMQSLNTAVNAPNGPEVAPKVLNQNVTQVPAPAGEGSKVSRLALAPLAPEVAKVPPCLQNLGVEAGGTVSKGG